jgi:radical SAM protein with 4Fe4S-binding SPASM domain
LIPVRLGRKRDALPELPHTACIAPEAALYFMTNGDVRTCCMNEQYPLGNVVESRLPDIWDGERRRRLVEHLENDDYSLGCSACDWQVDNEGGEDTAYARRYDEFAPQLAAMDPDDRWPVHIEFNLSNSCNLQCIQCNPDLSSSIRIHRAKLPPLPKVYDDQFFEDLVPFIAHVQDIQIAGGEPFMGAETLRLFDLIAEHAQPGTRVVCITNGTKWNRRVEEILERVPMSITISIDGITKESYEAIRLGSDFDALMTNIDRFVDYTKRIGTATAFNHCLMVQNYHEFGDLLLYAEARNIKVNSSVVYRPTECSLGDLDADSLGRVCDELEAQDATVGPQLQINAGTWSNELVRLRQWHRFRLERADDHVLHVSSAPADILGIKRFGVGPTDEHGALEQLRAEVPGLAIHWISFGAGDNIIACSPGVEVALQLSTDDVVGLDGEAFQDQMVERFGPINGVEVLDQTNDRVDQLVTYGETRFRATAVAIRDEEGCANEVRLLFADPSVQPVQS